MVETAAERVAREAREEANRKAVRDETKSKLERSKRKFVRECVSSRGAALQLFEVAPTNEVANTILAHLESWDKALSRISEIDDELMEFVDPTKEERIVREEEAEITKDHDTFKFEYIKIVGKLRTLQENLQSFTSSGSRSSRRSMLNGSYLEATLLNPMVKLQDVPIPKFDGKFANFPDWYSEFSSIVDRNDSFDDFQKMYLLKRSMIDDAKDILKDVGNDGELYKSTFQSLYNTYFNKRRIIAEHFSSIVDMQVMKNSSLREGIDKVKRALRGLSVCGIDVEGMSPIIAFLVSRKISDKLRMDWDHSNHNYSVYPSFDSLATFLINRSFSYETTGASNTSPDVAKGVTPIAANKPISKGTGSKSFSSLPEKKLSFIAGSNTSSSFYQGHKCVLCQQQHFLDQCSLFLQKSVVDRFNIVKSSRICLKCFKSNHTAADCRRNNCTKCNGKHHNLLHREMSKDYSSVRQSNDGKSQPTDESEKSADPKVSNVASLSVGKNEQLCALNSQKTVFLSTAVVEVQGRTGSEYGRVLLDQGSEVSLVTRDFCNRAKLSILNKENSTFMVGVTNNAIEVKHHVRCVLRSRISNFSLAVHLDVVNKIPYIVNLSSIEKVVQGFPHEFAECDLLKYNSVDILLGTEYVEFVLGEKRHFIEGLVLRECYFGYVISGSHKTSFVIEKASFCGLSNADLSEQLRRFMVGEEVPDKINEKVEQHAIIDNHFESTYSVDQDTNKFVVRLPLKETVQNLTGSFSKACSMLVRSERRRSQVLQKAYEDIFNEYLSLGHMSKISSVHDPKAYYMPHHIVSKSIDSHRIVFNASFIDNSGTSLNSHLLEGPKVQPDLVVNIRKFRRHLIAFTGDIFRMYRCILVHPVDRIYQRIVFRFHFDQEVNSYELNTLTNGVGPGSYIAQKCIEKVASFIRKDEPDIAEVLEDDMYMDNVASGASTVDNAICIRQKLHSVLCKYGFPLRKYQSNSREFLSSIPDELIDTLKVHDEKKFVNLLGLLWYTESDELAVDIRNDPLPPVITKRVMLSDVSKTFDILGFVTPVMIRGKLLLQELWKEGRNWDEEISSELREEFENFRCDLSELSSYAIPRCYFNQYELVNCQLIGFCDASTRAACAVVYIRSVDYLQNVHVSFVCSKSRIAPIKPMDIHRLELVAALVLAKLIVEVSVELSIDSIFCFSDSQVALSWLNTEPLKLKQFVSNRVSVITSLVDKSKWFYVEGKGNPADLGTRGISSELFLQSISWRVGPEWLSSIERFEFQVSAPFKLSNDNVLELKEEKRALVVVGLDHPILSLLVRRSSISKCVSIVAFVMRYVRILKQRCLAKKNSKVDDLKVSGCSMKSLLEVIKVLDPIERNGAYEEIIRVAQRESFPDEYDRLANGLPISKKSKLLSCEVVLSDNGILRSRGRTVNSSFSYDARFPIVLSVRSRVIMLVVENIHMRYFHAGVSFVLNFVRSKYWVVGNLLSLIKKIVYRCVVCTRVRAKCNTQLMGDLPKERLSISRPFTYVGVDLTGSFLLKCTNHRSVKNYKVYLAFFVCMVTRAVHIEIVSDLTTEEFLNALERFVARRGLPKVMYSDNATNFVGSRNVLNFSSVDRYLAENQIDWKTITPRTPHQGGIWEASVKAGKSLLSKAIGSQRLTLIELHSIATKVEGIMNARPIAYRKTDSFVEPLTPGHFLIGGANFEPPIDENAKGVKIKERYFLWRRIVDSFWQSWRKDYFNQIRNRTKWKEASKNLKVGDVVLICHKEENVYSWPLGIVEIVFPDQKGLVRNVLIRLAGGKTRQVAVQNLVLLPVSDDCFCN